MWILERLTTHHQQQVPAPIEVFPHLNIEVRTVALSQIHADLFLQVGLAPCQVIDTEMQLAHGP